jgi:hypothetical protein
MTYKTEACSKGFSPDFIYHCLPELDITLPMLKKNGIRELKKAITIQIAPDDLETLKGSKYKLCFAKKVKGAKYNVVWQSYGNYLANNQFSWTPEYQIFGSNQFQNKNQVQVSTNLLAIEMGEKIILDSDGNLKPPSKGDVPNALTLLNKYGNIHPGVEQSSTGIDGKTLSTPIYVTAKPIVPGTINLTPLDRVLVWFEQGIKTSTIFTILPPISTADKVRSDGASSYGIEIDLTGSDSATWLYKNGGWTRDPD